MKKRLDHCKTYATTQSFVAKKLAAYFLDQVADHSEHEIFGGLKLTCKLNGVAEYVCYAEAAKSELLSEIKT